MRVFVWGLVSASLIAGCVNAEHDNDHGCRRVRSEDRRTQPGWAFGGQRPRPAHVCGRYAYVPAFPRLSSGTGFSFFGNRKAVCRFGRHKRRTTENPHKTHRPLDPVLALPRRGNGRAFWFKPAYTKLFSSAVSCRPGTRTLAGPSPSLLPARHRRDLALTRGDSLPLDVGLRLASRGGSLLFQGCGDRGGGSACGQEPP
jgi:hypothetical protein